jgi:hypothetical protein
MEDNPTFLEAVSEWSTVRSEQCMLHSCIIRPFAWSLWPLVEQVERLRIELTAAR